MQLCLRLSSLLVLLHLSCAAALAQGTYEVPCQPRAAFVARLQALVKRPERADADLTRFSVSVRATGPDRWLTSIALVTRPDELRTLQDTRCETAVEAAALLMAAWMDGLATPPPAAAPVVVQAPKPPGRAGASLYADGQTLLLGDQARAAALGTTISLWMQRPDEIYWQLGMRIWPAELRLLPDSASTALRQKNFWELTVGAGQWYGHFGPLTLGIYAIIGVGTSPAVGDQITTRFEIGPALRLALTDWLALRYQLGISLSQEPLSVLAVSALGLDVTAFEL